MRARRLTAAASAGGPEVASLVIPKRPTRSVCAPCACVLAVAALWGAGCSLESADVRAFEDSMNPTIRQGDLVTLDEDAYDVDPPLRGDIVALRAPAGAVRERCGVAPPRRSPSPRPTPALSDESLLKRVIGVPGDLVAVRDGGRAWVNDDLADVGYTVIPCEPRRGCDYPRAIEVPRDHFFVLGDNRPYSSDSRHWGPVPRHAIEGRITPSRDRTGDDG